jgi:hypothetical protein
MRLNISLKFYLYKGNGSKVIPDFLSHFRVAIPLASLLSLRILKSLKYSVFATIKCIALKH